MGTIIGRYILPHPPVLIPEIGKKQIKEAKKTAEAFASVASEIAEKKPDTIIIISPHAQFFRDYFFISDQPRISGDMSQFGKKNILLGFDNHVALARAIAENAKANGIPAGSMDHKILLRQNMDYDLDHGIIVPMYFICHFYQDFRLVPVALSGRSNTDHYRLGMAITEAVQHSDCRVVLIASGDLSHKLKEDGPYGFAPQGPEFDDLVETLLIQGDAASLLNFDNHLAEKAAQCGLYAFDILLGTLEGYNFTTEVLSHEGPFGVGYMVAKIREKEKAPSALARYNEICEANLSHSVERESFPQKLARQALQYYLETGKEMEPPQDTPKEWLEHRGGTFVCFKNRGDLRGCIGTLRATHPNLAEEIISNAVSAGTKDHRFPSIHRGELAELSVTVDVLGPIEDIDSEQALDPHRYGVVVSGGGKRGVLLPNLEDIDTVEMQIRVAKHKAGINRFRPVKLQRFEVTRYGEEV